jgi:hypothetical protein
MVSYRMLHKVVNNLFLPEERIYILQCYVDTFEGSKVILKELDEY